MGLTTEEKQAIISYRMEKSRKTMVEAVDNATLGHWSLVANRLYYSAFHAVYQKDSLPRHMAEL